MSTREPSLPDKVVAIDEALTAQRVAHAFGGALALAYYAEPRATIDIDVNVFVAPTDHPLVLGALEPLGVDPRDRLAVIEHDGQARWWWGRTPIDLFFAYDEIHEAMRGAVRRVPFGDDRIPILGPEHLAVCKIVFDRPKDWIDIEQMLVGAPDLDGTEVARWLDRMLEAEDPRHARFVALAERAK